MSSRPNDNALKQMDRRLDSRYSVNLEAIVDDAEHGPLTFKASGFSRTGAFLQRRDNKTPLPAVGSVIKLLFNWPLETQIPPVRVEAKVIRQTNDGVGVQFELRT